jgi:S1-C subfamily serine protease
MPVFVGSISLVESVLWPAPVWILPSDLGLAPGTFVFTVEGAWVGLIVDHAGNPAIAAADALVAFANQIVQRGPRAPGRLGFQVAPLTPATMAATGRDTGLIVSWVDPRGPAKEIKVADVIVTVDSEPLASIDQWRARALRLAPGDSLGIGLFRGAERNETRVTAHESAHPDQRPIGLTLRTVPNVGVEVVMVEPGSAAWHAGLRIADILTRVAGVERPTEPEARRALAARVDRPIILAVNRAGSHHIVALERPR